MPKTNSERDKKNQTSPDLSEMDAGRLYQIEIEHKLAELKALAREVADAWISDKSGVKLVAEQRR
jgi:hypothetical protein